MVCPGRSCNGHRDARHQRPVVVHRAGHRCCRGSYRLHAAPARTASASAWHAGWQWPERWSSGRNIGHPTDGLVAWESDITAGLADPRPMTIQTTLSTGSSTRSPTRPSGTTGAVRRKPSGPVGPNLPRPRPWRRPPGSGHRARASPAARRAGVSFMGARLNGIRPRSSVQVAVLRPALCLSPDGAHWQTRLLMDRRYCAGVRRPDSSSSTCRDQDSHSWCELASSSSGGRPMEGSTSRMRRKRV